MRGTAHVRRLLSDGWEARACPSARPKCERFICLKVDLFERQRDETHTAPVRRTGAGVGRGWRPTPCGHEELLTHTFVNWAVAVEGLACRIERRAWFCGSKPGQLSKTAKTLTVGCLAMLKLTSGVGEVAWAPGLGDAARPAAAEFTEFI